jgi:hypothetical protein
MKRLLTNILLGITAFFLLPSSASAALLFLDPVHAEYGHGDTFVATLRIDNQGECINALDVTVEYDNQVVNAIDVGMGDSLVSLWVEKPTINQADGQVNFIGGIPGGYCGRVQGDPGQSNVLAKIAFSTTGYRNQAKPGSEGYVRVASSSEVLLNDGLGSPAKLTFQAMKVSVGEPSVPLVNEWVAETTGDTTPPEPFEIRVQSNPSVWDGQYYIVFSTQDKQSGLDHFEVFETDLNKGGYAVGTNKLARWQMADEPNAHLLTDQTLKSRIVVKAIDKAGNEQIEEFTPSEVAQGVSEELKPMYMIGGGLIGAFALLVLLLWLLGRRKSHEDDADIEVVYEGDADPYGAVEEDPNK